MSELSANIIEKIDLYVTGKLSPIDATQFESEISSDPILGDEVNFQKDVINSIKESRGLELKTRLQGIEVSSKAKWFSKAFLSGTAATVVLGIIGFSYYEYSKNDNNPEIIAETLQVVLDYTPITLDSDDNDSESIAIEEEAGNESFIVSTSNEVSNTETLDYENINAPDMELNSDGDGNVSTNTLATLDDLESVEIMKSGAINVKVEFHSPNSKKLAYKFYDQKLHLFGKFNDKNPYEVIEINTKFGKEYYLKFDKSYFTIKNGIVDKTPLLKVDNEQLVNKLNNLN